MAKSVLYSQTEKGHHGGGGGGGGWVLKVEHEVTPLSVGRTKCPHWRLLFRCP